MHMNFFNLASAFTVVAVWACCHHVRPFVLSAHMARDHVVNRHAPFALPAVLTGIIVAAKYLTARQLYARSRTVDLHLQPNDRWPRNQLPYSFYVTASVHDHIGFARHEQSYRTACGTDIDRFEIGV